MSQVYEIEILRHLLLPQYRVDIFLMLLPQVGENVFHFSFTFCHLTAILFFLSIEPQVCKIDLIFLKTKIKQEQERQGKYGLQWSATDEGILLERIWRL